MYGSIREKKIPTVYFTFNSKKELFDILEQFNSHTIFIWEFAENKNLYDNNICKRGILTKNDIKKFFMESTLTGKDLF